MKLLLPIVLCGMILGMFFLLSEISSDWSSAVLSKERVEIANIQHQQAVDVATIQSNAKIEVARIDAEARKYVASTERKTIIWSMTIGAIFILDFLGLVLIFQSLGGKGWYERKTSR